MNEAWILTGCRTPIGKFLGGLKTLSAPELGAVVLRETLSRAALQADSVDEVIMGNVITAGIGQAPARQAALKAGLPTKVAALTVNKVCGSGLKAIMLASQSVQVGDTNIVLAGGMESMSQAPHLLSGSREGFKLGDVTMKDSMIHDGLWCAFDDRHMGEHAEYTANRWEITREDQDAFALASQQKAAAAIEQNAFAEEIVPVTVTTRKSETVIDRDEGPRPETDAASLAKLRPAFLSDGTVTAGNASTLSDGAAAVLVCNQDIAADSNAPWKARILASDTAGTEPKDLFVAPVAAVRGAVTKAGLSLDDIDLFELNEAFASQMLACQKELQLPAEKVNIHGGAIALGHPIGASGARILVTLLSALHQKDLKSGVASLCLGGGNAVAMVVERDG